MGAAEGVPLRAGLAGWGAGLVLAAVLFVALLIITATPVRVVASAARLALAGTGRGLGWLLSHGFALAAGGRLASAARHPSVRGARRGRFPGAGRGRGPAGARSAGTVPPGAGGPVAPGPGGRGGTFSWAGLAGGTEGQRDGDEGAEGGGPAGRGAGRGAEAGGPGPAGGSPAAGAPGTRGRCAGARARRSPSGASPA